MSIKTEAKNEFDALPSKLVGRAASFRKAIADLPSIARSDAPVLICGETGTGKELIARAIHYLGSRSKFPFVPINCGAFSENLLEDELFGHERGAFTDARQQRVGLIAQADGGTVFLDEVDSLPFKAQVDLLRVLQEETLRAIGSNFERRIDVQIVSATNVPLDQLLQRGDFRQDLYYRLAVFAVHLPPLRERREDIMPLAHHFLGKHTPPTKTPMQLSAEALSALEGCVWPGNVRELENAIIRGIHLARSSTIQLSELRLDPTSQTQIRTDAEHWQPDISDTRPLVVLKRQLVEGFERRYLSHLLACHEGNVSRVAKAAGKERRDMGRLLQKYRLDPRSFRPAPQDFSS
ncbi:sigma-54 interaction domain-containing protein [Paraburkholderia terrae]|uniref:Sigma-54-dependent Fis family transcriptional regulator n=1 Tax=Paraburkholderia terrae TaxID=311230 RepID=A0A2I8EZX6_9BURK|nr:sigma-54 dependent transcriptional regulator [Paraburkholderia terrae]AUT64942.1 sigma-54-dependent Fis family transcriptional regulator [Paraburkholderia terrae]